MIEVDELEKTFGGEVRALNRVSFSVQAGEIIGLLGPNGAGKTTLMQILAGYLQPSAGTARIGGYDVLRQPGAVQELIGYLPENAPLYPELTVQSYLMMIADLRRLPAVTRRQYLAEAVTAAGLEDRLTQTIGTLSKGYRQRVGLAQAILHKPRVLIFDEPTSGLDPTQIMEVRRLIRNLAQNSTVLLSTHILPEVEATCDRVIIIMRGEVKADARLADLAATTDAIVTLAGPEDRAAAESLAALEGVGSVETAESSVERTTYRVKGLSDRDLCPAIYELARKNDWRLTELRRDVRTLESVFNQLAAVEGGVQ